MLKHRAALIGMGFATGFVCVAAFAQEHSMHEGHGAATQQGAPAGKVALATPLRAATRDFHPARDGLFYKRNWGVEVIGVHPVTSGYMLEFRYRIVDGEKAKQLNDRKARAYIIDEATGIRLAVPALENVGELRPDAKPEDGRNYFMIFGNPGKVVKLGSRVSVVVGNFRVDGLVVN